LNHAALDDFAWLDGLETLLEEFAKILVKRRLVIRAHHAKTTSKGVARAGPPRAFSLPYSSPERFSRAITHGYDAVQALDDLLDREPRGVDHHRALRAHQRRRRACRVACVAALDVAPHLLLVDLETART